MFFTCFSHDAFWVILNLCYKRIFVMVILHCKQLKLCDKTTMYCNCWPPCCLLIFRYCYNGNLAFECPEGYYCPAGTDFNWQQCPPGTYNNDTGLQAESDCKSCPGGYYCDHYAQVDPTEECTAGHYCQFGLDRATPIECNNTDVNGLCTVPGKMRNTPLIITCCFEW